MLFNSYIFVLLFLPLSVCGYFILNKFGRYQVAKAFLLLMSLWFYAYFNFSYLFIIVFSIIANYFLSKLMLGSKSALISKALLAIGLTGNIGSLVYFKYYDFFLENINALFKTDFNLLNILLPLGISFFTFQQLSFVIDSYKKKVPAYNILDYSLFVTFFPQLIAGPIVLHSEIVPQFADTAKKKISFENLSKGITVFSWGLAKKVLIADIFGIMVGVGFTKIPQQSTTILIIAMLAYTFQIYFDFSGYCDMATGIGLMFNINIPMNFNSPYKALTITDFWDRWHITLTRFFTTYVYIPLGGNRKGQLRCYVNIMIVFLLSGLWHGASWTFIIWGVLHGIASVLTRIFKKTISTLNPLLSWAGTFIFLNFTWMLFRAQSLTDAKDFLNGVFKLNFGPITPDIFAAIQQPEINFVYSMFGRFIPNFWNILFVSLFIIAFCIVLQAKNAHERLKTFKPTCFNMLGTVILLVWCIISFSGISTFLYFNF